MSNSTLISVIVPVYNCENSLDKCIKSILDQTHQSLDIILVDDGSSDNSGHICDEYSKLDKRVQVIHTPNCGVSCARNTGINNAKGEYIVFIDSDDYVDKEYVSALMADSYGNSLVVHGLKRISTNGNIKLIQPIKHTYHPDEFSKLLNDDRIYEMGYPVSKLYHRMTIIDNKLFFEPNLSYAEDMIFTLNYILHVDKVILSPVAYYNYIFSSSTLNKLNFKKDREFILYNSLLSVLSKLKDKYNITPDKKLRHTLTSFLMSGINSKINNTKSILKCRNIILNSRQQYGEEIRNNYHSNAPLLKISKKLLLNNWLLFYLLCKISTK